MVKGLLKIMEITAVLAFGLSLHGCPVNPGSNNNSSSPSTSSSSSSSAPYAAEKAAIIKAADRLCQLQNANGLWDWDVTTNNGPTGTTYPYISGVIGVGLEHVSLILVKHTGDGAEPEQKEEEGATLKLLSSQSYISVRGGTSLAPKQISFI